MKKTGILFEELIKVMATLRQDGGCPWDKEQTHRSLRQYLLEETYEVLECLDTSDRTELAKELGDLLLQIVFHAQIANEQGHFNIDTILANINKKLIDRHPHVFADDYVETAKDQEKNWERLKKKEGRNSVLEGVPGEMPGLARAYRLQQKASAVGFDWPDIKGAWDKFYEELKEFQEAISEQDKQAVELEYGDILFALCNIGRFIDVNPEDALRQTNAKFIRRFSAIEEHFKSSGRDIRKAKLEEMDAIWERVKTEEK